MASIQISQLAAVTSATDDDVLIINDGDINTRKITYSDLTQNLVSTSGSQVINGDVTINGNLITDGLAVNADLITVDIPNQRIGILTTTPAHTLDVGGNVNIRDGAALRLCDLDSSNAVTIQAPNVLASDTTYTWPNAYPPGPNNVLASNSSGALSWQQSLTDPMGTAGDLIYRDITNTTRPLPAGAVAQVLTVGSNGIPEWGNNPSGFADPMTTAGDLVVKNAIGVTTRLPIGLPGQALSVAAGQTNVEWSYPTSQAGGNTTEVQFNLSGGLSGASDFIYDSVNRRVSTENLRSTLGFEALGNSVLGDTAADFVTINGVINSNLTPNGNGGFSIGQSSNRWGDLWMTDTINFTEGNSAFGSLNFSYSDGYKFAGTGTGNVSAKIQLNTEDNLNHVSLSAPASADISTSYNLVLPPVQGDADSVLTNNGNGGLSWTSGNQQRKTVSGTTGSISDGSAVEMDLLTGKTYVLHDVETSAAAWVTFYTDPGTRTVDASRPESTPPAENSGILGQVFTTTADRRAITPGKVFFNNGFTPSLTYLKVENQSGSTADITVTLTYLVLED